MQDFIYTRLSRAYLALAMHLVWECYSLVLTSVNHEVGYFLRATAYMLQRVYAIARSSVRHTGGSYKNG